MILSSKTRGNGANLNVRRPVNNLVKKVFNYRTAIAYNNLPVELKQASSIMFLNVELLSILCLH
jgi:hypothetical protein